MRTQRNAPFIAPLLFLLAVPCAAEPTGLLLAGGRTVSFPWRKTDGAGFVWDIYQNGNVQHGTNYAYGSAMMLQMAGQQFYAPDNNALLGTDGREVQIGPLRNGTLRVWRRVYVDGQLGYARWIDLFENTDAKQPVKIDVQYQNYTGNSILQCVSTVSTNVPGPKDWGFATGNPTDPSRPSLAHFYASRRSPFRPTAQVSLNNNSILYQTSLEIPPGRTRALCFFEVQRNTFEEATALLRTFRPERELARLSRPLREAIVNIRGEMTLIGRMELPRRRADDLIVLRDESEVHGTIQNDAFSVETSFGSVLNFSADTVVGLEVLSADDCFSRIALTDGQIVTGVPRNAPIRVRLRNGKELTLPLARIRTAAYRLSADRPEEIIPPEAMLVFRSGQRLRFDPAALSSLEFQTEYGVVRPRRQEVRAIRLSDVGRLHRLVLCNGSMLTGLWLLPTVQVPLSLGPKLSVSRETLAAVEFVPAERPGEAAPFCLRLANGDVLRGTLAGDSLPLQTEAGGEMHPDVSDIRLVRRLPGGRGRSAVVLRDGTTVRGTIRPPVLRFAVTPDVVLDLPASHVVWLRRILPTATK